MKNKTMKKIIELYHKTSLKNSAVAAEMPGQDDIGKLVDLLRQLLFPEAAGDEVYDSFMNCPGDQ
jgi:hypothetical protein